jgi:hypothetical protein
MRGLAALLLALLFSGCVRSIGPRTIQSARMDYNEAISRSWDEQLLLNLVRLRYRDNPLFVDISSVTASYSFGRNANVGTRIPDGGGGDATLGAGVSLGDNPVISYNYLNGAAFAQRLLSPLSPDDLSALARAGWSIERLLLCCTQRINDVPNAVSAAGPTPELAPRYEAFQSLARMARELQQRDQIQWEYDTTGQAYFHIDPAARERGRSFRELGGVELGHERYALVRSRRARSATEIATEGRSLLGVLYFLSHSVQVPAVHREAGLVTVTRDTAGAEFDWERVTAPLMRIHSGRDRPRSPAVAVQLRDHWYWIADDDLNSKTTFALLRLLLFLKSGDAQQPSPLVTIPVR